MNDLSFYRDRDLVDSLPKGLADLMLHRGLIAPDHKKVHFCGFVSWDGGIASFLPRNSGVDAETPEHAFHLLIALKLYYSDKITGLSEGLDGELIGKVSLSLAFALIEDYQANGLYVRRTKRHSLNQGRPDWKKTISRQTPYPSDDTPVYLDIDSCKVSYVSDCETARIHAKAIREITQKYGVLLFGNNINLDDILLRTPSPFTDKEGQLAILDREMSQSYSERDIKLIEMLRAYVEKTSETEGLQLLVGTRKFHNVWEGMIDKCLPRKIEINSLLPVPYYQQTEYLVEVSQKGQRTDTVIETVDKSRWAVIDAKYYDASSPATAPGWHDLVKQYFYKTAAEKVCGSEVSVSLHFIFPGAIHYLDSAKVGESGQNKISTSKFKEVEGYGEISCHYCDPSVLIRRYTSGHQLEIDEGCDISGLIFPA